MSSDQWQDAVPVRDVEVVRSRLRDLDGVRLAVGQDSGDLVVQAPIPEEGPVLIR